MLEATIRLGTFSLQPQYLQWHGFHAQITPVQSLKAVLLQCFIIYIITYRHDLADPLTRNTQLWQERQVTEMAGCFLSHQHPTVITRVFLNTEVS